MDGKKRKVMFLIYSLCGGGAERVLVETVNRLPKDRYDVTLMTLFHDDTRAGMLSPEVHYRPALRKPSFVISSSRMRQRVWNMKLDMSLGLLLPAKQKFPSE